VVISKYREPMPVWTTVLSFALEAAATASANRMMSAIGAQWRFYGRGRLWFEYDRHEVTISGEDSELLYVRTTKLKPRTNYNDLVRDPAVFHTYKGVRSIECLVNGIPEELFPSKDPLITHFTSHSFEVGKDQERTVKLAYDVSEDVPVPSSDVANCSLIPGLSFECRIHHFTKQVEVNINLKNREFAQAKVEKFHEPGSYWRTTDPEVNISSDGKSLHWGRSNAGVTEHYRLTWWYKQS
jgi:hypothetical protein